LDWCKTVQFTEALLEAIPTPVFYKDREGRYLGCNQALTQVLGLTAQAIRGKTVHEIWPAEVADVFQRMDEELLRKPGHQVYEAKLRDKYGFTRNVLFARDVFRDDTGRVAGIVGAFTDITERMQVEEALRSSEKRYRQLVEHANDALFIAQDGLVRSPNGRFSHVLGRPPHELEGQPFLQFIHPDDRQLVLRRHQERISGVQGLPSAYSFRLLRHDQTVVWVELNTTFVEWEGRPATLNILRDITDRKRGEEMIVAERTLLRTLIDSLPDYVYVKDPAGRYLLTNLANAALLGLASPNDVLGKTVFDLFPAEHARYYAEDDREVLETGRPVVDREEPFRAPSGREGWFSTTKVPLRDAQGRVVGLVGITRDVTERKRAEEERRQLDRQMQQTQKLESLGVLAGGIAHDFNNLLTAILGHASLALDALPPASPAREHLHEMEQASRRAAELCRQMLAYSGRGQFVIEPVQLNRLVEEMVHLLKTSISKKTLLNLQLAPNLPQFQGDATQIRQVLMNLVLNASEAIGDNQGVISVSTGWSNCRRQDLMNALLHEALPEGIYVWLEVADTGPGMNPETLGRIFEPFFTTKFTGRGLGLSAVLGIVRGHKGTLNVYSEPGLGTRFKVLLPAIPGTNRTCPQASMQDAPWTGSGTVLVVDDEESVRITARKMIEGLGFRVLAAEDGREAVDLFRQHQRECVLVLLDLTMPRLNGEETFRELKRLDPRVCVLMSSGYSESELAQRFAGTGLAGFLQKPYTRMELQAILRKALAARPPAAPPQPAG
jgi:PAS domain S-box-containing protein